MEHNTSRTLEITVISGEGLSHNGRRPVKKNAFVTVRTDFHNYGTTKIDTEGGSNPSWNEKLVVDMPMHARFVTVEVQCKSSSSSNKMIGAAIIPVSDFIGGFTPVNYVHFLSYRLRDGNGERNGIINLSVRVKSAEYGGSYSQPWTGMKAAEYGGSYSQPWSAMKTPGYGGSYSQPWRGTPVSGRDVGGVVTGVPVWY